MKLVIQRVLRAAVVVDGKETASIQKGLLVLLGIEDHDTVRNIENMAGKVARMRIFSDANGKFNHSLLDVKGDVLVVSQFTLCADTSKGNRPSFIHAATSDHAKPLYLHFVQTLHKLGVTNVENGEFGAYMEVSLLNNGPVTIVL